MFWLLWLPRGINYISACPFLTPEELRIYGMEEVTKESLPTCLYEIISLTCPKRPICLIMNMFCNIINLQQNGETAAPAVRSDAINLTI